MNFNDRYRVNQPAVIAEIIDSEAIIVNLDSGAYYSLRDSGCAIWEMLAQGLTVDQTSAALVSRYAGAEEVIAAGVTALTQELLAEQLMLPVDAPADVAAPAALHANGNRPAFQPPLLEKYTDMADLLLLDPIHEVDETGWPHAAPPQAQPHG